MSERALPVLAGDLGEVPYIRLPGQALFRRRAQRLRELAERHAASDWLLLLAALSDAQHAAATARNAPVLHARAPAVIELAEGAVLRDAWRAPSAWRSVLEDIVRTMERAAMPAPARAALASIARADDASLVAWAEPIAGGARDRLASDDEPRAEAPASSEARNAPVLPARAPFLAAALQVHLASLAAGLSAARIARSDADCPVCAAPAAVAVVGGDDRLRYLACSLCASAWHRTRVQCATCGETGGLSYYEVEVDGLRGVKAEACGACRTYMKIFYEASRPELEPLADDAATLALDLLLGEEGYARGGLNPLVAS